jgi:hypothetical protein
MHIAGKVLLILGGIITVIGIVMIVGGAAAASFDPTEENVMSGTSGSFDGADSGLGFSIWVSEDVPCEDFSIEIYKQGETDNQWTDDCWLYASSDDDAVDDYYEVASFGLFDDYGGTYTVTNASHTVYITDSGEEVGEAVGGFFAALGGVLVAICGGVLLLIGLILALTLKSKEPAVIVQQGGQMMGGQMMQPAQQMQQPVQQMPQQTTQQGYEFEQK